MTDRYEGKPLLRLLECYVLWCVGKLPGEHAAAMEKMTPYLQKTFSRGGTWQQILESVMELPSDMPERVRAVWTKVQSAAAADETEVPPEEFAMNFVDRNLR